MENPREIYAQLLAERRAEIAAHERRHKLLGYARLAMAAAAAAVVWTALANAFTILWVLIPAALFLALVVVGERLLHTLERRRRAVRFFEKALARLDGSWPGTGETGERYLDPVHPYAQDLDLFGKGSLFELLSTARTYIGEDTLARWLLDPADPATVRARQAAVDELRPRLDLREDLAVLAEEARKGVDPAALASWGAAPPLLAGRGLRLAVWGLTLLGIAGAAAGLTLLLAVTSVVSVSQPLLLVLRDSFLLTLAVNGWFFYRYRKIMGSVVAAVEEAAHELGLVAEVLVRLERESFHSPCSPRSGNRWLPGACRRRGAWPGSTGWWNTWIHATTCSSGWWRSSSSGRRIWRSKWKTGGGTPAPESADGWPPPVRWKRCARWPVMRSSIRTIHFRSLSNNRRGWKPRPSGIL